MALPGSGQLSFSAIAGELGVSLSNVSLRNMSSSASFSTPDRVSDFYGYSSGGGVTYTYYNSFYAGDPCYYDYKDIYLGSDGIYYAPIGATLYPMFAITQFWYEYLYYEPAFGANVYNGWEVDNSSTVLMDQGYSLSYC
jgi:hypothetical protein